MIEPGQEKETHFGIELGQKYRPWMITRTRSRCINRTLRGTESTKFAGSDTTSDTVQRNSDARPNYFNSKAVMPRGIMGTRLSILSNRQEDTSPITARSSHVP
ncbi:hypothetical protein CsSME_00023878 [Camellia sinensis var. sinensis]|uniref:Uncharacterized protein n=1 Tax=Camellia sinensis TaxID=4442 RepID=A0A7J7GZN8_CAMSI|nr:hypothetical protein HYC85_016451 [Camellia sinensis]